MKPVVYTEEEDDVSENRNSAYEEKTKETGTFSESSLHWRLVVIVPMLTLYIYV